VEAYWPLSLSLSLSVDLTVTTRHSTRYISRARKFRALLHVNIANTFAAISYSATLTAARAWTITTRSRPNISPFWKGGVLSYCEVCSNDLSLFLSREWMGAVVTSRSLSVLRNKVLHPDSCRSWAVDDAPTVADLWHLSALTTSPFDISMLHIPCGVAPLF
jgi:hypothetical protein